MFEPPSSRGQHHTEVGRVEPAQLGSFIPGLGGAHARATQEDQKTHHSAERHPLHTETVRQYSENIRWISSRSAVRVSASMSKTRALTGERSSPTMRVEVRGSVSTP